MSDETPSVRRPVRPIVGEVVYYYRTGRREEEPLAAMITGLTRECEHLVVFPPNELLFNVTKVPNREFAESRGIAGPRWDFPSMAVEEGGDLRKESQPAILSLGG